MPRLPTHVLAVTAIVVSSLVACSGPSTDRPRPPISATTAPSDSTEVASSSSRAEDAVIAAPSAVASGSPSGSATASASAPGKRRYVVAAMGDSLTDAKSQGGKYLDVLREHCPKSRFDNYGKGGQMVNQMNKRFARDILGEDATSTAPGATPLPSNAAPSSSGTATSLSSGTSPGQVSTTPGIVSTTTSPSGAPPGGDGEKPTYTHVIVFGGVNDLCSDLTAKRTVPKIERDLSSMYRLARDHHIRVIALTVSPWGDFTKFYNPSRAATTTQLNRWIRGGPSRGETDAVIDAYSLLSCGDPERLCPGYIPPFKDGLHFNKDAHRKLGEALFTQVFSDCE